MNPELSEIKRIRRRSGLTQSELARLSSVSQSLIAKIESGRIDPTYTRAKKIFEALDTLNLKQDAKAAEIMVKRIITAKPDELVTDAISRMRTHKISQMPVLSDDGVVGMISETTIVDALASRKKQISSLRVRDVMSDAPPIVSEKTSTNVISLLLRHFPIVLVSVRGKLSGVITKADLLARISG